MSKTTTLAVGTVLVFRRGRRMRVEAVAPCTSPGCHRRIHGQPCDLAVSLTYNGRLLDADWHTAASDVLTLAEVAA